jgi:hypothetical protein
MTATPHTSAPACTCATCRAARSRATKALKARRKARGDRQAVVWMTADTAQLWDALVSRYGRTEDAFSAAVQKLHEGTP